MSGQGMRPCRIIGDMATVETVTRPAPLFQRLDRSGRICAAVCFALLAGVVALAYALQPDGRGHGTHQQLGLAPCFAMQQFKTPCPFCGMTTAFSHFAHGRPRAAVAVQPAGAAFFVGTLAVAGLCLTAALTGRWTPGLVAEPAMRRILLAAALLVAAAWIYKIAQVWSAAP